MVAAARPPVTSGPAVSPAATASGAPQLAAVLPREVGPRGNVSIRFRAPVSSPSASRVWVTIAEVGAAESRYLNWKFVVDGEDAVTLEAPGRAGAYEVRVHTNYPTQSFHVVATLPLQIVALAEAVEPTQASTPLEAQRFTLASTTVAAGGKALVRFPVALHAAPGERFWITIVSAELPDTRWGAYAYVPDGAKAMELAAPTQPGDHEVRLHGNYPKLSTHVVHRATLHVVAP